jgi:ssDNA-binding Zn-finger/Zn-ribbon topoisomerase 1
MKKLIEKHDLGLIICDNPKCNFKFDLNKSTIKLEEFINRPCPNCGQNLLTQKDYNTSKKLIMIINFINKWFSWITIFMSKKRLTKTYPVTVRIHNGIQIEI